MGLFMAFQYPVAIPGVTVAKYLRHGRQRAPRGGGRGAGEAEGLPHGDRGGDGADQHPQGVLLPLPQRRLLGRREEAHGDPPARHAAAGDRGARRDRLRARHRRPAHRRRGRQQVRRARDGRPDHHPLPADPPPDQAGRASMSSTTAASSRRAAPSWWSSSRRRATAGSSEEVEARRRSGRRTRWSRRRQPPPPCPGRSRRSGPSSRSSNARSTAIRSPTSTTAPPRRSRWR